MSARRAVRASEGEWREMSPPRRDVLPSPSALTLRSLAAGVLLMFVLGVSILAGAQLTVEGLHWLLAAFVLGGAK